MFSKLILGTEKTKYKMSWFEYIFTHLIPTAFQSMNYNYRLWYDLMTGNYEPYKLLENDDPFTECYGYFWTSINLDETYPKEFLEELLKLSYEVENGLVETYSLEELEKDMKILEDYEEAN